jgi:antitoxin HicB
VRATRNRNLDQYQFTVRPLSKEEGGGYLAEYPDIPGCMSDGETIEAAIANGRQRLPRTLYSKLTKQAENEGVSINSLVTAIIAEAIGAKQARS